MNRLIVDCQILQTKAFDRGMGKYTLSLLKEFIRKQNHYDRVELLFSDGLDSSAERMSLIEKFLGSYEKIILSLPTDISNEINAKYELATEKINDYIESTAKSGEHTDFLITSPFFVDFPAVFPTGENIGKYAVIYDIIPQKIWHLLRIFPDDIYFKHFNILFDADKLFTISEAVKDDLASIVGIDEDRIQSIDGGPFGKLPNNKLKKIELEKPFIIYPSAPIVHKNNERAVRAFDKFNRLNGNKYTLYITSTFNDSYQEELKSISNNIRFTGNISDEELAYAYTKADVLFFPSLSEGLGMPVLEAVQYGVPVACSNIPVLAEISDKAFYQFNPTSEEDIVHKLTESTLRKRWDQKHSAYKHVMKKYTWEETAKKLERGLYRNTEPVGDLSVKLILPNPATGTPAACLGEMFFAYAKKNSRISVEISGASKSRRATFLPYVDNYKGKTTSTIKFSNKISPLGFKAKRRKVKVSFYVGDKKQHIILTARRIFKDNAVQLEGWEFADKDGRLIYIKNLYEIVSGVER